MKADVTEPTTIRLPLAVKAGLAARAERERSTVSAVAGRVLAQAVRRWEAKRDPGHQPTEAASPKEETLR